MPDFPQLPDFVPDSATLSAYALACIVLFCTPGPDMSLTLAKTISGGRLAGLAVVLGTSLGCIVHAMLAAVGISALIAASPTAFLGVKVAGALYLLWLAFDAIRHGCALNVEMTTAGSLPFWRTLALGLAVNLTNPKVILFFVTFLPQFVRSGDPHAPAKLAFLGLAFVVLTLPLAVTMVALAGRLVAGLRKRPRILRVIDWVFAGIFGAFAAKILSTQS